MQQINKIWMNILHFLFTYNWPFHHFLQTNLRPNKLNERHNFYCRFPQKHFVESPEAYPVNNVLESIWTGLYSDILTTWLLSKSYHQIWAKIVSLRNVLFKCKYQHTGSTEFLIAVHPLFFTMGNCLCWVGKGRHRTIISTTKIL